MVLGGTLLFPRSSKEALLISNGDEENRIYFRRYIYCIYIYTYTIYYNIIFLYRPLNVQVSKKLARLSHNHNMSNIVGPDNILTRLSSLHGPSFRSRGKGAASLWLNMTEGQTESESKNMNIILYMRIINTII